MCYSLNRTSINTLGRENLQEYRSETVHDNAVSDSTDVDGDKSSSDENNSMDIDCQFEVFEDELLQEDSKMILNTIFEILKIPRITDM